MTLLIHLLIGFCGVGHHASHVPAKWLQVTEGDRDAVSGRALFDKKFKPITQSTSVDGLGPMFNAESCATCHPFGGSVGNDRNVQLISFVPTPKADEDDLGRLQTRSRLRMLLPSPTSTSFMLPRKSTNTEYPQWRMEFMGLAAGTDSATKNERIERIKAREFANRKSVHRLRSIHNHDLVLSERNTPALFGAGVIDRIAKATLQSIESAQLKRNDGITGRVANVGSRIGRFGWRGQTATLKDFVAGACRNELGLQERGNFETRDPLRPNIFRNGDDLSDINVHQLTRFVSMIPAPKRATPKDERLRNVVATGRGVMRTIHCDRCHQEDVGEATGIFSDLLLHDMGSQLSDPLPASPKTIVTGTEPVPTNTGYFGPSTITRQIIETATTNVRQEWRTPPLWGVADSAPYMHDGRAASLTDAIMWHGGEATASKQMFIKLPPRDKKALIIYLKHLRAPTF